MGGYDRSRYRWDAKLDRLVKIRTEPRKPPHKPNPTDAKPPPVRPSPVKAAVTHVNTGLLGTLSVPLSRLPDAPGYKAYDAVAGNPKRLDLLERDDDLRCKPRPDDNTPHKDARRGKGGGRAFIPWCR